MAADTPTPPVSALTARKTWRTLEPLHNMVYFAPEAHESYRRLGLRGQSGYFASRAAPMGAVGAHTVVATFYNFSPQLVHAAMEGVWESCPPAAVLEARTAAAGGALRRMLGEAADSSGMDRAAALARRVAERAAERPEGRPLFAGHAGLPWPEEPHLVLWHAQTLLREFRGDGHVAQLVDHGIGPVEAMIMHEATGDPPAGFLRETRGWPAEAWDAATERLRSLGWVRPAGTAEHLALSEEGAAVRGRIEEATDRLSLHGYEALGEDGCAELRGLARPFSRAVVATADFGLRPS